MDADEPGCRGADRSSSGIEVPTPRHLATMERIPGRSRVEPKMNCIKLLGQFLMARDFDRQVAGLQVRIAVLNGYTALGIPVTQPVE